MQLTHASQLKLQNVAPPAMGGWAAALLAVLPGYTTAGKFTRVCPASPPVPSLLSSCSAVTHFKLAKLVSAAVTLPKLISRTKVSSLDFLATELGSV